MGIKRYTATSDTTITNAYKLNLTDRATDANMGASDILEVFSIYGQASSTSAEISRALLDFPITTIDSDRTDGDIPTSGSVSFYLRLFNAKHSQTVPRNFTLTVSAISSSWAEGVGLDMESYTDLDSANWIYASDTDRAATAVITLISTAGEGDLETKTFGLTGSAGDTQLFTFNGDNTTNADGNIGINGEDVEAMAKSIVDSINDGTVTIGITASPDPPVAVDGDYPITLTQDTAGTDGNTTISNDYEDATVIDYDAAFTGGNNYTPWVTEGGDYFTDTSSSFDVSFDIGVADLEVDITPLVEQWLDSAGNVLGSKTNYGIGVALSGSHEDDTKSYYTKRFFARGSEFFFKRPVIEARWNSAIKDDRANFYVSSSLASPTDNLNTLYFYNYVRGQLKNIPSIENGQIYVKLYTSGANGEVLTPSGSGSFEVLDNAVTGGYVSAGVYSASFALDTSASIVYDRWFSGSNIIGDVLHTSSFTIKTFAPPDANPQSNYVTSMTNLKSTYSPDENARFRLYTRKKDWNPTIYTKSSTAIESSIVEDAYYKIFRIADDEDVINYGTGSTNHTKFSFDSSGSYFDLDMSLLERDYAYGIKLVYFINNGYREQSEIFKFRVE